MCVSKRERKESSNDVCVCVERRDCVSVYECHGFSDLFLLFSLFFLQLMLNGFIFLLKPLLSLPSSQYSIWKGVNMFQEYSLSFVRPCLARCNVLLMNIDTPSVY